MYNFYESKIDLGVFLDGVVMVLFVDDQVMIGEVVCCLLVSEVGIDFYFCFDLQQVVVVVNQIKLMVIFQDLVMFGVDGFMLFVVYCGNLVICDILIIVLLIKEELMVKSVVFVVGVNDYLVKLFDVIELVVWICYYLCLYIVLQ